jgi:hypothetical protein
MIVHAADEMKVVTLRWKDNSLVAEQDLRPGDQVKIFQADELPVAVIYIGDEPTLEQVVKAMGLDTIVVEMPPDKLPGLPLSNLSVFGMGTFIQRQPGMLDAFGIQALESLAALQEVLPWYLGYLLGVVRDHWEDTGLTEQDGLWRKFAGESFDGVAGRITGKAYKTYMQWIQCASLYLRNTTGVDWLRQVTVDHVMHEVRITNAWIAASAVNDGSITVEVIAALLSGQPGAEIKHALATRNNGTKPDAVEPETVRDAIQQGTFLPTDETPAKQTTLEEDDWVQHGPATPQWVYDEERNAIGYWLDGGFTVAMRVVDDSLHTSGFLVKLISRMPIKPSRYRDTVEEQGETTVMDNIQSIVAWYNDLLRREESVAVRKQVLQASEIPLTRITQAVRHRVKSLMLEAHGDRCPIDPEAAGTDMHEVILLRNDAPPATMLAVGAFNPNNCIIVSRAVNRKAENAEIRGELIVVMEERGYDPVGWGEKLRDDKMLKGFHMPKIAFQEEEEPTRGVG